MLIKMLYCLPCKANKLENLVELLISWRVIIWESYFILKSLISWIHSGIVISLVHLLLINVSVTQLLTCFQRQQSSVLLFSIAEKLPIYILYKKRYFSYLRGGLKCHLSVINMRSIKILHWLWNNLEIFLFEINVK